MTRFDVRDAMRKAGIALIIGLLLPSGPACEGRPPEGQEEPVTVDTLSFLALGDSYTIGESVEESGRWPVQLAQALRDEGIVVADPVIVARTGWTTDELEAGIQEAGVQGTFDLVSLLIGVNNQYRGRDVEEYREEFRGLLQQALGFARGGSRRVVVLSIPDWGVTPFAEGRDREAIAREIDAFNAVARSEAEEAGVPFVDVTGISREADVDSALVAGDGLHPSAAMYARWVQVVLPVALSQIEGM
jgi:lysophospholipase L1-like esterase